MPTPPSPPVTRLRLADLRHRQPTAVAVTPDAAGRAAIAADLGILGVTKLHLTGTLTPAGKKDWHLDAELGATVVQECIVTLAPVRTRIVEAVTRRYLSDMPPPGAGEVEMPEDDSAEALPAVLDLTEVMVEALALALPLWPRAAGAEIGAVSVTEPGALPLEGDLVRPFAGLAAFRDSLQAKGRSDETP